MLEEMDARLPVLYNQFSHKHVEILAQACMYAYESHSLTISSMWEELIGPALTFPLLFHVSRKKLLTLRLRKTLGVHNSKRNP